MAMRDREYRTVENITLICYTVGLIQKTYRLIFAGI